MDAWYIMLSKWGTKTFADVLAPAIDMAERGVPIGGRGMNAAALQKYPTSVKLFAPPDGDAGARAKSGRIPIWRAPGGDWLRPKSRRLDKDVWPV